MRNFLKNKMALVAFLFFLGKGLVWLGLVYFGFTLMDFAPLT